MAKTMQKSAQIMGFMNQLVRLPQLNKVMMTMAREMEKAGLIEEVMDDVLDTDDQIEEEAEEEVSKVIEEITMGLKTATPGSDLPEKEKEQGMQDLEARLSSLKA